MSLLNLIFALIILPSPAFSKPICADKFRKTSIEVGDILVTAVKRRKLTVLKVIGDGHKGLVYKVKDATGNLFAYKIAKNDDPDVIDSIHREPGKYPEMRKLGVPIADIVEYTDDYILKEWAEGIRGDQWIVNWKAAGMPKDDPAYVKLFKIFDTLIEQGVYVQNLKDLNLIYNGQDWVIVDFGGIKRDETIPEIREHYRKVFKNRWIRHKD